MSHVGRYTHSLGSAYYCQSKVEYMRSVVSSINLLFIVQICCQLLKKTPDKRLGSSERDAEDIKRQAFFRVSSCCVGIHLYASALF